MKKLLTLLLLLAPSVLAQNPVSGGPIPASTYTTPPVNANPTHGTGAPSGTCMSGILYTNDSNGNLYSCNAGTWGLAGGTTGVTHTGNLTLNSMLLGNGVADVKIDTACVTNGTGALSGCTSISAGSGASTAGATATGGFACVEAASTGWTPTAGQDYQRCDSTAHAFVCSNNGAAESACSPAPSFPVTVGGTVTSGGIPYFSSTVQESSSALLAANALVVGGGAGAAPTTGNGDFTYASHTLTAGAAAILDLNAMGGGGLILPTIVCSAVGSRTTLAGHLTGNGEVTFCPNGNTTQTLASIGANSTISCTNQVFTTISGSSAPTCSSLSAFVTSDYTNATTTPSNVTGLAVPLAASTNYAISCKVIYQGSAATASMLLTSTGPASPTKVTAQTLMDTSVGAGAAFYSAATDGTTFGFSLGPAALTTTATDLYSTLDVGVRNGVNAGTWQLQASSNGAGTITIKAGSFCTWQ